MQLWFWVYEWFMILGIWMVTLAISWLNYGCKIEYLHPNQTIGLKDIIRSSFHGLHAFCLGGADRAWLIQINSDWLNN